MGAVLWEPSQLEFKNKKQPKLIQLVQRLNKCCKCAVLCVFIYTTERGDVGRYFCSWRWILPGASLRSSVQRFSNLLCSGGNMKTFPNTIYLYLPMSAPLFPTSHFLFLGSDICYLLNEMIYTGVYMALAKVVISHALLHTQEHALLSWPSLRILDAPLPLHNHCHIPIHIRRMPHSQLNLSIMT